MAIVPRIFISYRQDDSGAWAVLLAEKLRAAFGSENVFLDKDQLHAGAWQAQLNLALAESCAVIVLIGKGWAGAKDQSGNLRLAQEHDVHRNEILLALAAERATVVPGLSGGATLPDAAQLPAELHPLLALQVFELSAAQHRRAVDLDRLISELVKSTGLHAEVVARDRREPWIGRVAWLFALSLFAHLSVMTSCDMRGDPLTGLGENSVVFAAIFLGLTAVASGLRKVRSKRSPS